MKTNAFKEFLQGLSTVSNKAVTEIEALGIKKTSKANSILFHADKPFLKLLFLEDGLIRAYRIIDGKDVTFYFFTSREFVVDYESFLTEYQSPLFFETIFDSHYLEFDKATILTLYDSFPEFERVGRLMAENAYLSATKRLKEFQTESLQERYLKLLERDPKLFQKVPQYHIASYLGVSPQSLSRIRAQLLNRNY